MEEMPLGVTSRQVAEAYAGAALMKATYLVALFGIAATSVTFAIMNVGSVRDFNRRVFHWVQGHTRFEPSETKQMTENDDK
jgi:hypothetical protein